MTPGERAADPDWYARERAATEAHRTQRLEQAASYSGRATRLQRWSFTCGTSRLALFATAVWLSVVSARGGGNAVTTAMVALWTAFVAVVAYHGRVLARLERARHRAALAAESAARIAGGIGPGAGHALPEPIDAPLDLGHAVGRSEPAAFELAAWSRLDLGVEGSSPSLHELLDTTSSQLGARRLQYLLRHPLLDAAAIRDRQQFVQDLVRDEGLRDDLAAAFAPCRGQRQSRLALFLGLPRSLPGGILRFAVHLLGILTLPLVLLAIRNADFLPGAAACAAASLAFNLALRRRAVFLRDAYLEIEPVVRSAREIAPRLRNATGSSQTLAALQQVFDEFTRPGSPYRLRRMASQLRMLHLYEIGFLYGIVQLVALWDLHWLMMLESEVKRTSGGFERLASALADLEAHLAIATWASEQPGTAMPVILDPGAPRLEIDAGEHPLLRFGGAVPNDLHLGGDARLAIVTGSNMAGKSTFLRMVAANTILAQMGAPVRARDMRLVPIALHANINVRDSLADGKSYFLVEVERVREMLAAADANARVLGIFDELFRGTNSRERLAASREIARHLGATGGLFLLATHDQDLARSALEERMPGVIALHFRDAIENGRMVFPYTVESGIASTTNAIRLLEIAGYPGEVVRRARAAADAEDRA